MHFYEIAQNRQSCRAYDANRAVEEEKINAILESVRLSPSACNGQPYHLTVCQGEVAREVAKATMGMGMNKFAADAPVLIVISEEPYCKTAALGAGSTHIAAAAGLLPGTFQQGLPVNGRRFHFQNHLLD